MQQKQSQKSYDQAQLDKESAGIMDKLRLIIDNENNIELNPWLQNSAFDNDLNLRFQNSTSSLATQAVTPLKTRNKSPYRLSVRKKSSLNC